MSLGKASGYRVKFGQSNKNFISNAAVIAFIIKAEDLSKTDLLAIACENINIIEKNEFVMNSSSSNKLTTGLR